MRLARNQEHILRSLKTRGPQSVRILARQLAMTAMGVRHHLAHLMAPALQPKVDPGARPGGLMIRHQR